MCDCNLHKHSQVLVSFGVCLFVCFWCNSPQWAKASSFTRFIDHTRRTTVRTPLDEGSARRRDLYLIAHNTQNRQTSMPPVEFEPIVSVGERPQTYALDRAAAGTDISLGLKAEGKAVPLQARRGSQGSRKLRFPDFVTTAQDGGSFSANFTPRKCSWCSFLLEAESTPGP